MARDRFPDNSFWIVAGDTSQLYWTTIAGYVSADDARYLAWLRRGNQPSAIGSEQDLWNYLNGRALDGTPITGADSTDEAKQQRIDRQLNETTEILFQVAFDHENRIRVLESRPTLATHADFFAYVKTIMK